MRAALLLLLLCLAAPVHAAQLSLTWQDNAGTETGFRIERAASEAGPWAPVGFAPVDAQSYVDASLADGTRYCYRVFAVAEGLESDPSNVACKATPIPAPSGLTIVLADPALGRVTSTPGGLYCGRGSITCAKTWPVGQRVSLAQTPAPKARFTAWSGACVGQPARGCALTITGPLLVGAAFHAIP